MSFLLFTGACIQTWNKDRGNEERRCTFYEIFHKEKDPPEGQKYPYRYPKVSDELFEELANSNFPPPLLAVATSDVIPLNLLATGERYSFSKPVFAAKVAELASKAGNEGFREAIAVSDAHFRGDTLGKTVSDATLVRAGEAREQLLENVADESAPDIYAEIDERNGWKEPGETPQPEVLVRWNPRNIIPGTKVQNIEFHGGWKISRRMASYWRKNRAAEYRACCNFIRNLLKKPLPRAPSLEGMASIPRLANALLVEDLKRMKPAAVAPAQ